MKIPAKASRRIENNQVKCFGTKKLINHRPRTAKNTEYWLGKINIRAFKVGNNQNQSSDGRNQSNNRQNQSKHQQNQNNNRRNQSKHQQNQSNNRRNFEKNQSIVL